MKRYVKASKDNAKSCYGYHFQIIEDRWSDGFNINRRVVEEGVM